ncbi:AEC family transporter [Candidatus Colwellia aromaticivorans]|uniref:AEC family transporter n=1 Tax=Candidatus Colwellia aromaticivorans TaxID=2267621 RepID=UPI000DF250C3|nr:AEC family transporter [Candidatus Colwellia aromaticivorans]
MNIIAIISPLILVGLLGFICTKSRWLSREQLNTLSKFTFSISIPAFLFYQMAKADFSSDVSPQLFAAFYLPVLICYLIAWLINYYFYGHKVNKKTEQSSHKNSAASAVFALSASYSNNVIVGLPVLLAVIGEQVIIIVFLIVTMHSAMLFTLTAVLAAKNTNKEKNKNKYFYWLGFIKHTLNNPLIISILTGLLVNILGISLPDFLQESLTLIGKPAITLALFTLGGSLTFYHVRKELTFISIACVSKLILLPILVYITTHYIFSLQPLTITVLVILSACPTAVNAYLIALTHQQHQQTVAGTVVVSTLLSTITIPLWLSLLL